MPRRLPKHVHVDRSRHGRARYYFRVGRGTRVRLPDSVGSPEFKEAVKLASESGVSVYKPNVERPSFAKEQRLRVGATLERALRGARRRAIARHLPFDLDLNWAISTVEAQEFKCPLSGVPFFMECTAETNIHPFSPSLDRIDPRKGYTTNNVRIVVYAINVMLMDWGVAVFERVVNGYRHKKGTKVRTLFPNLVTHAPAPQKIAG